MHINHINPVYIKNLLNERFFLKKLISTLIPAKDQLWVYSSKP